MAEMRSDLDRALRDQPEAIRTEYLQATRAREAAHDGGRSAYSMFCRLAALDSISVDARTLFLAQKAGLEQGLRRPGDAVETLRSIVTLRNDNGRVQYLADLQIARLMAQQGGGVPEFQPTIADLEKQYQRIFSLYSPYDKGIIEAKLEFANQAMTAAQDAGKRNYLEVAARQVQEAQDIVDKVEQNPSLVMSLEQKVGIRSMKPHIEGTRWSVERFKKALEGASHSEPVSAGQEQSTGAEESSNGPTSVAAQTQTPEGSEPQPERVGYALLQWDGNRLIARPAGSTPEEIKGFMFQVVEYELPWYGSDGAQLLADTCGKAAAPPLLELLGPEVPHTVRLNSLLCLGKIGDHEVTPKIIKFIETPKDVPFKEAYDLVTTAMVALAYIGNDAALDYIEEMMTDEYWQKRRANPDYAQESWLPEEISRQQIRGYTVDALSFSGTAEARTRLLAIQSKTDTGFSTTRIKGAIDYCDKLAAAQQKKEQQAGKDK